MELGKNICRLRTGLGLSQEELASRLGVSRQSVSKWETGTATPELDKVAALARLFGVTIDELVLGEAALCSNSDCDPGENKTKADDIEGEERSAIPRHRFIAGVALLCTGWAITLIFLLFGGGLFGLIFSSPLLICGLVCITVRRHVGFWCAAGVYLPVYLYLKWGTGVNPADLLHWSSTARASIYVLLVAAGLAVIACGVRSFSTVRLRPAAGRLAALAAGCVLCLLPGQLIFSFWPNHLVWVFYHGLKFCLMAACAIYGSVLVRTASESRRPGD